MVCPWARTEIIGEADTSLIHYSLLLITYFSLKGKNTYGYDSGYLP